MAIVEIANIELLNKYINYRNESRQAKRIVIRTLLASRYEFSCHQTAKIISEVNINLWRRISHDMKNELVILFMPNWERSQSSCSQVPRKLSVLH